MTLPIAPGHARQLAALRAEAPTTRIVVVGAAALGHHLPLARDTKDIDLALAVEENEVAPLMARVRWTPDRHEAQRWNGPDAFRVDIVPAAPALILTGKVQLAGGHHTLSLVGFDLAYEHAEAVDLPGTGSQIEVASLLSLVVLKMTAFLDRPHARTKDLADLDMVLREALPESDERRWAPPLRTAGVDFEDQSAFLVGAELASLVTEVHRARIERVVRNRPPAAQTAVSRRPASRGPQPVGQYPGYSPTGCAPRLLGRPGTAVRSLRCPISVDPLTPFSTRWTPRPGRIGPASPRARPATVGETQMSGCASAGARSVGG